MKKFYSFLITAILMLVFMMPSMAGWGQTKDVLFHETFGDNSGSAREWDDSYSVKSGVASVYSGITGYTVYNVKQGKNTTGSTLSGLNQTLQGTDAYIIIGPLNVLNYESLNVTYQWKAGSIKGTYSTHLYYATSSDGTYTEVSGTGEGATTFVQRSYSLPEACQISTLYLKVVFNTSNTQAIIDEFELTGTASGGGGTIVATPTFNPVSGSNVVSGSVVHLSAAQGTTIYYTCGTGTIDDPTTSSSQYNNNTGITVDAEHTTIKAIASDGNNTSSVATATYTILTPLTTMQDIYNTANNSNQTVFITFNNWVVSGASQSYAYVTDGTKGLVIINYGGHGFIAGDILSGTAECTLNTYNGNARLMNFSKTAPGLTTTTGGTVSPAEIAMADLAGVNCGALVSYNNLTCSVSSGSYYLSDGTTTIQVYTTLYTGFSSTLVNGKIYNITGVYVQSNDNKQICPRSANDIVPVITPATLPFNWAGGGKADLMALQGVTANGLGSDYSSSTHGAYIVRMDDTGDYIMVRTDSQPDVVTIGVKMIGGSSASKITVQASTDGVTFDTGEELEISGSQNDIVNLESTRTFDADVRYIRLLFTRGSNVGVGPISITKYSTEPIITVSPNNITDFSYSQGYGPSVKSFTVEGSNLGSTTISIAFETGTNFEMALTEDAANWSSSVSLTPTDGTVSNISVYVRMKAGLEEGNYSDNVNVTCGSLSETVSLNGTVNPAPVSITYNLVTTVTPGKHYIIVSTKTGGTDYVAMGGQNGDYRDPIDITVTSNSTTILSNAGVTEIAISGDATNGYTLHATDGYLVGGTKTLKNNGTASSTWTISFSNNVVTISAGDYDIKYNSGSPRFNCYGSGQRDIYLYEKANDSNCDIYSATNISNIMTVAGDMNIHAGVVTVMEGAALTVIGTLDNNDPANLVIKDGAQLITDDVVEATIQKNISAYTVEANDENNPEIKSNGWYFISYPVNCDITQGGDAPDGVTNLLSTDYDLYSFDPTAYKEEWVNYKKHTTDFKLTTGHGYLYANSNNVTLEFAGSLNFFDDTFNSLEIGWNLVGNPYTYNAYPSMPYYKMNNDGTAIESVESTGAIAPCTGILVYSDENNGPTEITYSKTAPTQNAVNHGNIQMSVAQQATNRGNATTLDNAIVSFNEGSQLKKFYFGNQNANLYIPQGTEEYAIVSAEAQGEMPVNFKANQSGEYTISINTENVEMNYLHLIDNLTGNDVDLLVTPSYTFNAKTDDYASRFRLVFSANNANNGNENDHFAFISNGQIVLTEEGNAQVFDVMGRMVSSHNNVNHISTEGLAAGVYVIRLTNGNETMTQKIVVK